MIRQHECAPVVRLLSDSICEVESLIEEYLTDEGNFILPSYITVQIETNNNVVTSMRTQWKWDYESAESMLINITIGRAIGLSIMLSKLAKRMGVKLSPNTPLEVLETFRYLMEQIPELSEFIVVTE